MTLSAHTCRNMFPALTCYVPRFYLMVRRPIPTDTITEAPDEFVMADGAAIDLEWQ